MRITGGRRRDIHVSLDEDEAELFRKLIGEMHTMLDADVPATDAVKRRLFPQAYQDPDEEQTFRDLVGSDLQNVKLEAVRTVRAALGEAGPAAVKVGSEDVEAWLRLLTDLRLAIGTRLGITEDWGSRELDLDDPNAAALWVLDWLTEMQGRILERVKG